MSDCLQKQREKAARLFLFFLPVKKCGAFLGCGNEKKATALYAPEYPLHFYINVKIERKDSIMRSGMSYRTVFGVVLMIVGVASIVTSLVIKSRINEGKIQISSAQERVDTGNSSFSRIPVPKEIGRGITRSAQNEINAGNQTIYHYILVANFLLYGGIALFILGTLVIFVPRSVKKG